MNEIKNDLLIDEWKIVEKNFNLEGSKKMRQFSQLATVILE
ncbi:hypothetical protein [Caloramator sp. Dgby_cultured_2]|nr:hypothetical protein [Caloramator sp. Dgby_cultured_2]WDU83161.1 hypothetical protein PWK10_17720 [Caloramator sp. Dgby_cultured_2]